MAQSVVALRNLGINSKKEQDELIEKKNTLMQEYSKNKEDFSDLIQYQKNYDDYLNKEVER